MIAWVVAVGRVAGLGSTGGARPALTLAVIGIVSRLAEGPGLNVTFSFLSTWVAISIFVVLALLELSLDKIPRLDRLQGRLTMPYRVLVGAVAGAATIPFGWHGVLVGVLVGGAAGWFAQYTRMLARPKTVSSDAVFTLVSLWEDLAVLIGTVLTLVISPLGYGALGFTAVVYWRVGKRRRDKYRRLRRWRNRAGGTLP